MEIYIQAIGILIKCMEVGNMSPVMARSVKAILGIINLFKLLSENVGE